MPEITELQVAQEESAQEGATIGQPTSILARITVGAILQIQSVASPAYYAVAAQIPGRPPMVLAGERGGWGNPDFVVTMYDYDGRNEAKISLLSKASPAGFWSAGKSIEGFPNPLVIDNRQPGHFLLTDTGRGISIQNTFGPPEPYIRLLPPGIAAYLGYGFPDTGGNAGLFRLSIVG
jgi:hypothetical protein